MAAESTPRTPGLEPVETADSALSYGELAERCRTPGLEDVPHVCRKFEGTDCEVCDALARLTAERDALATIRRLAHPDARPETEERDANSRLLDEIWKLTLTTNED